MAHHKTAIIMLLVFLAAPSLSLAIMGNSEKKFGLDGSIRTIGAGIDNYDFAPFYGKNNPDDGFSQTLLRLTAGGRPRDWLSYEIHALQSLSLTTRGSSSTGTATFSLASRKTRYRMLDDTRECAAVLSVHPLKDDGHAFVSVGWAGILGGWTFFNEKGLFIANNLGGGWATNPTAVPTLILERIIAQKAGSVEEAVRLIRSTPRMRGQVMVIAQTRTDDRPA
ncbi:MAG: carcinine hydrolase/isopenicillin-N N-acyltransferase family protein, partial [bacterium]